MTRARRHALPVVLASALANGCLHKQPLIPIEADRGSLEFLVGDWSGTYAVDDDPYWGSGTIFLTLSAADDRARGSVLMIPNRPENYGTHRGVQPPDHTRSTEMRTIQFIRVIDGIVSGVMDPYWDYDSQKKVSTAFRGLLTGTTMEGTFQSQYDDGWVKANGRWKVTRRP